MMDRKFSVINITFLVMVFFGALFTAKVCLAGDANDHDILTRFKKPMPEVKLLSDDEFFKASKPIRKKPYGDKVLAYTIRIPKNWTEKEESGGGNFILSKKLFLDLN